MLLPVIIGLLIFVVPVCLVAIAQGRGKSRAFRSAPRGSVRVETVSFGANSEIQEYAAHGWKLIGQSRGKNETTLTFRKN